jgi:lysophospholipase L1-like esterase
MKLILLGDSHLARENQDGVTGLIPRIRQDFQDIEIMNFTNGGANTVLGLEIVKTLELTEKADAALVMFGTNDAASWKLVPLENFTANYEGVIEKLKRLVKRIILVTPPPVNEKKQIPPGRSNKTIGEYAKAVAALADKQKLAFVDLFSIITDLMKAKDVHMADGVHLNDLGYEAFYKELEAVFVF